MNIAKMHLKIFDFDNIVKVQIISFFQKHLNLKMDSQSIMNKENILQTGRTEKVKIHVYVMLDE